MTLKRSRQFSGKLFLKRLEILCRPAFLHYNSCPRAGIVKGGKREREKFIMSMMRRIMVDFLQVFLFVFLINSAFGDTVTFNSEVQEGPESHNEAQQNVNPIDLYTKGMDLVDAYEGDSVILEEARNYFQTVLNEYPASPYGYLGMSEIAQLEAYQSWIDFDKASMEANALPLALKARELAPDFYEVHDRLANVYRALHQFDVAEKEVNT